jgi:hypothetical protein
MPKLFELFLTGFIEPVFDVFQFFRRWAGHFVASFFRSLDRDCAVVRSRRESISFGRYLEVLVLALPLAFHSLLLQLGV